MSLLTVNFKIEAEEAEALAFFVANQLEKMPLSDYTESALYSLQYALSEAMPEGAAE